VTPTETPPDPLRRLGSRELSERWGVAGQRARYLLTKIQEAGFTVETISRRRFITERELGRWETAEKKAGRSLPGTKKRGPKPSHHTDPSVEELQAADEQASK
jgi:hypothetical protein